MGQEACLQVVTSAGRPSLSFAAIAPADVAEASADLADGWWPKRGWRAPRAARRSTTGECDRREAATERQHGREQAWA
jgi:hypothetical protein